MEEGRGKKEAHYRYATSSFRVRIDLGFILIVIINNE